MSKIVTAGALVGALALTGSAMSAAQAQPDKPLSTTPAPRCFYARDWTGWKGADDHTMYVRVNNRQIYRLDFDSSCHEMTWPDSHLITTFRGTDSVCSPLDLDIKVADSGGGFAEPCIVSKITPLSPADVAALPKTSLP